MTDHGTVTHSNRDGNRRDQHERRWESGDTLSSECAVSKGGAATSLSRASAHSEPLPEPGKQLPVDGSQCKLCQLPAKYDKQHLG